MRATALFTAFALTLLPVKAHAQTAAEAFVADAARFCRAPSASIEQSAALLTAVGRYRRVGDFEAANERAGRALETRLDVIEGTRQSWRGETGGAQVLVELRPRTGAFGQVIELQTSGVDAEELRAAARAAFGEPARSDEEDGLRVEIFPGPERTGAGLFVDPANRRPARVTCSLPTPPPDPSLTAPDRALGVVIDEIWRVCGAPMRDFGQASELLALLPGRYRRAPEDVASRYADDAELLRRRQEAGVQVTRREVWGRLIGAGPTTVVTLNDEMQRGSSRLVAYYTIENVDAGALTSAIIDRFGPATPMASDRPVAPHIAMYGENSPSEPRTRQTIHVANNDRHQIVCTLPQRQRE